MVKKPHKQATAIAESDRRTKPRIKAGFSVLLRTPNAHPMEACLLEVSSIGVRLRTPEPVAVGATVRIEAQELRLFGTIKRCAQTHKAYEVGIVLTGPFDVLGELRKLYAAATELI
jgi:hypothetical protein